MTKFLEASGIRTNMTRAGREPAEDVKRRMAAACQEVGLTIHSARMYLIHSADARIVHVAGSIPGWTHDTPTIEMLAQVSVAGDWPKGVDIRCSASEVPLSLEGPFLKGRGCVPFEELVSELRATVDEREKVIAAKKVGISGPFRFEKSSWEDYRLFTEE